MSFPSRTMPFVLALLWALPGCPLIIGLDDDDSAAADDDAADDDAADDDAADDDTTAADDDASDDDDTTWAEGLDGGRVFLFHMHEPSSGGTLTEALARLYVPDDWAFLDHLPANGACGYNIEAPLVLYDYLDAGPSVGLATGQGTIVLTQTSDETGGPIYAEPNVPAAAIQFGGTYSLEIPGGAGLPAMSIPQAIHAGADFAVTEPNIASQNMQVWHRNPGATLQWTQGGTADSRMLIQLISIDQNLNPTGGNLTCTSNDGGGMVFGPVELAYLQNGYNALYVGRYDMTTWQNPFNGADGHGVFAVTKIGVIWLEN